MEILHVFYQDSDLQETMIMDDLCKVFSFINLSFEIKHVRSEKIHKLAVKQISISETLRGKTLALISFHSDFISEGICIRAKLNSKKVFPKMISCTFNLENITTILLEDHAFC